MKGSRNGAELTHNKSSEVVTLVTVCHFQEVKRTGQSNIEHTPLLAFDSKRNMHIHCVQNMALGTESNMEGPKKHQEPVRHNTGALGCASGSAFLGESLIWLQCWTGPAVVERRQFSSLKACLSVAGSWVPGGDECLRGGCAKKIWLAAEQLASAANSDWLAQEDPNYSTTAVSIIAAAGAVWAIRH